MTDLLVLEPNRVDSIPHALAIALKRHLEKTGKLLKGDTKLTDVKEVKKNTVLNVIVQMFSTSVVVQEPTCNDCGYSKCS